MQRALEHEERAQADESEPNQMVQGEPLAKVKHRKEGEYGERDDFLHGLELSCVVDLVAEAVRWHGKAVLGQRDHPAHQNDHPQRLVLELEMPYQAKVMNTLEIESRTMGSSLGDMVLEGRWSSGAPPPLAHGDGGAA